MMDHSLLTPKTMQRLTLSLTVLGLAFALVACGGRSEPESAILPTATAPPTQPVPTPTETPLPPPTVTSFPTVTPRSTEPDDLTAGPSGPGEGGDEPTPTLNAGEQPTAGETATPLPTNRPAPTSAPNGSSLPGVSRDRMIFAADFYQGWPTIDESNVLIRLVDGQYLFEVGPTDAARVQTTAVNQRDAYVQVEVTPRSCPEEAGYGLIVRYVDDDNYYLTTISCDNRVTAVARVAGSFSGGALVDNALPAGLDATSQQTHILGVLSEGDSHTLYFDDQVVGSFEDARHEQGDVALHAISRGTGVIRVAFDNLEVWTVR
jgi:hypothetical protein